MISRSGVERLVDELRFGPGRAGTTVSRWPLVLDFESAESWPDLPYDSAAPEARHDVAAQTRLRGMLGSAAERMAGPVPAAHAFVGAQLERVLLRRSERLAAAASGSNRACIGRCILTNLHLAADPVAVAIEGLVHESMHQRIYRLEADEGPFCDLGGPSVLRSPWTGSRLPLHSLVHATFVWFGLAMLWSKLRGDAHAAERLAFCRFGFQFLGDVIDAPSFPRASVAREVLEAMRTIAAEALGPVRAGRSLRAAMAVAA